MGDLIQLKEGSLPWEPPHSDSVTILNRWGIPLSGLVRQQGSTYFFLCLEGEVASANLWGYVLINSDDEENIINSHTHEDFEKLVLSSRAWITALSVGDRGIVQLVPVEDQTKDETALEAALRSLRLSEDDLDRLLATA